VGWQDHRGFIRFVSRVFASLGSGFRVLCFMLRDWALEFIMLIAFVAGSVVVGGNDSPHAGASILTHVMGACQGVGAAVVQGLHRAAVMVHVRLLLLCRCV